MVMKEHLRSPWEEKAFKNSGRSTRLTLPFLDMYTTMKEHALSIRYTSYNQPFDIKYTLRVLSDEHREHVLVCLLQNTCIRNGSNYYSGPFEATTHVVVGGGGASLADFTTVRARWSYFQDHDYGFAKLTAFNHSMLLLEYKRSSDGRVYDHFIISRDYRDVLGCAVDSCSRTTLAS